MPKPQSTATILRHLRALLAHLSGEDFSTLPQDRALGSAIAKLEQKSVKVWITKLVPEDGADVYSCDCRTAVLLSERAAYLDLGEWLASEEDLPKDWTDMTNEEIKAALDESDAVSLWDVEEQEIFHA